MSVEIIQIVPGNTDVLRAVADDVFDDDIDAGRLAAFVGDEGHLLFVALQNGVAIGQIQGSIQHHVDGEPQLYIDNLGVSPTHQRRGVATRLITAIVVAGNERGCTQAWIVTEPDNHPANALYTAIGATRSAVAMYSIPIPQQ